MMSEDRNARPLTEGEITEALASLPGWALEAGKLRKRYKFPSFARALGWMTSVAIQADKLDHHPDWCNSYNKVDVSLVTHAVGAVTEFDVRLAGMMEKLAGE
jgi:4a-hydroxytetrahydrobiopterin dehydratase